MQTRSLEEYQDQLLKKSLPLSERVVEAYYRYPRHHFVPEYNLEEAYEDHPLVLFNKPPNVSTISQPSFVLRLLDMLKIQRGDKVFELGAGSGWNAALISYLVGEEGRVITSEIIPELAERTRKILKDMKVSNAKVLTGDGFEGYQPEAPYDRIIFTAGSPEVPEHIFKQLKEEGLMIYVQSQEGRYDMLLLVKKVGGKPETLRSVPCSFVPVIRNKESRLHNGTL